MITADELERTLLRPSPSLPDGLRDGGYVAPRYDGLSLANLPASIAEALGAELPGACPPLSAEIRASWGNSIRRVILIVIDALGYDSLRSVLKRGNIPGLNRLAELGTLYPLTTIFPSTTNAVLTTLWTGHPPARHGLLAYELYLREWGVAAEMLSFSPIPQRRQPGVLIAWGLDPAKFVPHPGIATLLDQQGVTTHVLIHNLYRHSALSMLHFRGTVAVEGFISLGDFCIQLRRMAEETRGQRSLIAAYLGTVDAIGHTYGPESQASEAELSAFTHAMEREFLTPLSPQAREGTLLLITADHGQVTTPPQAGVLLDDHPLLRDTLLAPPVGESRVSFLYVHPDRRAEVAAYLDTQLGDRFTWLTREDLLESKLLGPGPIYAEVPYRLGDFIGLARGNAFFARNEEKLNMRGRHGGLTRAEMLVPLLAIRLD